MVSDMSRSLSFSEVSTAQTCKARWAFSYGGQLTGGTTLKSRHVLPILRDGRAWGAGVAAWHERSSQTLLAYVEALDVMRQSLDEDLAFMKDAGVMTNATLDQRNDAMGRLERMFHHYTSLSEPLANLTRLEDTIDVAVPSRSGKRGSSRYRFGAKIDGFTEAEQNADWIVEFKLRKKLNPRWFIELARQYLYYAWARQRESGRRVIGIVVDERLNAIPNLPKILRSGRVSSDKDQLTTVPFYLAACEQAGQDPDPETVMALQARTWQQRVFVLFRPDELEEAGRELVSAAKDIRDLDSGELYPVRNASQIVCNGCRFKRICKDPTGSLVDELFIRTTPKRLRDQEAIQQPQEVAA
jgi:hypothetical protein